MNSKPTRSPMPVQTAEPVTPEGGLAIAELQGVGEDYCGTTFAAKLMGLSVATVQALVEKGEVEAWKTRGGHRRISLASINRYLQRYSPQAMAPGPDPRDRLRVLVVEDDPVTRELYRNFLEGWSVSMDCSIMQSALEALVDIASLRPDVLITDLSMPGVDGIEMLKVLVRNEQLVGMQVLVVSGLAKKEIDARGGLPPDALFLPKPINFDWLSGYLSALLAAKRA